MASTKVGVSDCHPGVLLNDEDENEKQETTALKKGQEGASDGTEWPLWKLVLIALPQFGIQVLWCFLGPYSVPYMQHLGMHPAVATLNNVAGAVTGFFTGPIVGATSDNCTSRFGRRRPVIVGGLISFWCAGMLFAGSEHLFPAHAIYFAVPMYWIMDVTINILQTPNRALVADLAREDQQVPMQVVFVFMMAFGNFVGYSITQAKWFGDNPVDNMLPIMLFICGLNTVCVAIQFLVVKEKPLERPSAEGASCCAPVLEVVEALKTSPFLLVHLAIVQCLVWMGLTAWNGYAGQWFGAAVYSGDQEGTEEEQARYNAGVHDFGTAGQYKAILQLVSSLIIIAILLKTTVRPRFVYAPCIFIGAVACVCAAFFVGHNATFAIAMMVLSVMPETGSFAVPFGLVAILNKKAEEKGQKMSTALQMALLNSCITVGQQVCTFSLAAFEGKLSLAQALPLIFMMAAAAQTLAGTGALFLDDSIADGQEDDKSDSSSDTNSGA